MSKWFKLSLILNVIIIAIILLLFVNAKRMVKQFLVTNLIDVRYKQKISMFESCPENRGAIILLGNSLTEGGNWDELFEDKVILNRGIGGDITSGVLQRMDEVVRHQPSKLFICIGTNDLAREIEPSILLDNYRSIIKSVKEKSPETKIYVQSILPVGKKVLYEHNNQKIPPINKELKKMCDEMKITYIDLHPHFLNEQGYLNSDYTNDNLHLLGAGYLLWKDLISTYIYE